MGSKHTVKQGEHMASIAARYGFQDYRTVWEHPDNAELRSQRENPYLLVPGDVVAIPDRQDGSATCATGQTHRFVLARPKVLLRLRVQDVFGEPMPGAECELTVDGETYTLTADGASVIEQEIHSTAQFATLVVEGMEFPLQIGHLDPISEQTGVEARLVNLGYYPLSVGEGDLEALQDAAELFQHDQSLDVTGSLDEIADSLEKAYGV